MHKATALARLSSTTSVSSSFGGSSLDTAVRASIRATFDRLSSALLHRGHGATHRAPNGHAHGHGPRTGSTTASVTATLHACQVLISADAAAPETDRTLQLPQLVMDELEETVPRVLAMHGDDALRVAASLRNSSSSGHGDDTGSSTFLSSPHALNAFGAIVDRLLVATTREQQQRGPLAPVAGVHTTLYYTLDDMNGKPAPVVLPFHLPSSSAATRRFKSVGRWPGEFRSNNDESATTTSTTASADNNWFGKFLAKQNATHTAVAGGTSSAQQHAARAPSLRDPTPSIFRDPTLTPGDITRFILLADNEPYDALRTLDRVFPRARKTGVVGAWTPFVNGRAHTLWLNDEVMMGGGVVGLGYQEEKGGGGNIDENDRVHHLGVREIGRPFQITKCQGNIILELKSDDTIAPATPAQLLLDAAETINLRRQPPPTLLIQLRDSISNTLTTKRILSSDLARGHVAVEVSSGGDLREGTQVQFAVRIEGAYDEDDDDAAVMDFGGKTLTGASVLVGNLHDLTTMSSAASANASSSDASSVLEDAPLLISTESGFITSTPVKHHGHGDGSAGTTTFLTDVQTVGGAYVVSETV